MIYGIENTLLRRVALVAAVPLSFVAISLIFLLGGIMLALQAGGMALLTAADEYSQDIGDLRAGARLCWKARH